MSEIWRSILESMSGITFTNIVDIAIVTFVIYKLIQMIKETRAGTLIKGVVILFVALFISDQIHLVTISYILQQAAPFIVTAAIVIFQPELRRALEMVGRTRLKNIDLFGSVDEAVEQSRMKKVVEDITTACQIMSEEKVGALMVLERVTKIGEIISTGTIINADTSSELIRNIFFKNSPLHDGAMVIREGRIAAAGCFLPLSENKGISRQLGTRHRAGLGMSECCDAVVVIVSEETGAISIARDGNLTHNVSPKALYTILDNVLCPVQPKKESKVIKLWKGKQDREKEE